MRRAVGSIQVFTFKEGLMSAVAHDLRLALRSFEITLEGTALAGVFDLTSLAVEGPMQDGRLRAERYDDAKRADVEKAMHGEVLHTKEHPRATFTGSAIASDEQGSSYQVSGQLQLVGKSQPLSFEVRRDDQGTYRCAFELTPSRWGISQYKALLGAIKLKDVLRIELALSESPA